MKKYSIVVLVMIIAAIILNGISRNHAVAADVNDQLQALIKERKDSERRTCILNLKQIDGAVQMWAILNHKLQKDKPAFADIKPYLKGETIPICPSGGVYSLGTVADYPACSLTKEGHLIKPVQAEDPEKERKDSERQTCITNLKRIDGAVQQWALENQKRGKDKPTFDDIKKYLTGGEIPHCPSGGTYTLGTVAGVPACSHASEGHSLNP